MTTRLLEGWDELEDAAGIVRSIWGAAAADALASPTLLRTYAHYGNPVIGARLGGVLCGVSIAFLAPDPVIHLHSHVTGVLATHQHLGVGYELKLAQRRWCSDHGIDLVTWTFDPMLARNAHFNLSKLGTRSRRLLPAFYGDMDDDINRGDESDRLEVRWDLRPGAADRGHVVRTVAIPDDYLALRAADPTAARTWRAAVRDQLLEAFDDGLEIVGFRRHDGYRLARPSPSRAGVTDARRPPTQ